MNGYYTIAASVAICAFSSFAAQADCAAEIAKIEGEAGASTEGISKDGSLAPLQDGSDTTQGQQAPAPAAQSSTETVAKDGTEVPLAGQGNIDKTNQAMSGADAQAQQEGKPTAAQEAASDASGADDPLSQARAALAAGDEEACMKALEATKAG